jgi:hypothetical protein
MEKKGALDIGMIFATDLPQTKYAPLSITFPPVKSLLAIAWDCVRGATVVDSLLAMGRKDAASFLSGQAITSISRLERRHDTKMKQLSRRCLWMLISLSPRTFFSITGAIGFALMCLKKKFRKFCFTPVVAMQSAVSLRTLL